MPRLAYRSIALLTFVVGVAVWLVNRESSVPTRFLVHAPPVPVILTPEQRAKQPNYCGNFVVSVQADGSLLLNESLRVGSINDPVPLTTQLHTMFRERVKVKAYKEGILENPDFALLSEEERTEPVQVTIRASRSISYSDVMRVVDAAKGGGAHPILLQIDELPE